MSLTDRSCKCIRRRIRQSVMSANLRSSFALPKVRSDRYQGTQAIRLEFREPSPRRAASRDICGALKDPFTNPINLVQVKYNLRSHQPGSKLTVIFDPSCINDAQSLPPDSFHSTTYLPHNLETNLHQPHSLHQSYHSTWHENANGKCE